MSLHRECVLYFILLCTLLCATETFGNGLANNDIGGESGEDENLKEALLLVELLKNEYARAIRENFILRQRGVQATTEPPEEPTCASTTQLSSYNFRRRMPSNYLYGSDALRSLRREEEVSEDPAASESPEPGAETETVTAETETVATESDVPTNPPEPTAAAAAVTTDAPKAENAVKNKDEPVLSQVADELMSEMKGDKNLQMQKNTQGKMKRTTRNTRYLSAIKATLKIHLSKSTRLAVPLSKNNAFCYHNPKNALCRTSV